MTSNPDEFKQSDLSLNFSKSHIISYYDSQEMRQRIINSLHSSKKSIFKNFKKKNHFYRKKDQEMEEVFKELTKKSFEEEIQSDLQINDCFDGINLCDKDQSFILEYLDNEEKEKEWVKQMQQRDEKIENYKRNLINAITRVLFFYLFFFYYYIIQFTIKIF